MRKKLTIQAQESASVEERFQQFLSACAARGLSDKTLKTYRTHLQCIAKHLDTTTPLSNLTKNDVETAIASMRSSGLASNSISSYLRAFKSFLNWGSAEGYCSLSVPSFKAKETVKETYSDAELERLLKRPEASCSFCEYRNWVIVQFFLNSGCRASTVRHIQNKDVDLNSKQVIFRHNKTGRIQIIPLCSTLVLRLREYMNIRRGTPEDYLFCNEYGKMLRASPCPCSRAFP